MNLEPEFTSADDSFRDFCLWDYMPIAPYTGKLRSASLLLNSFEVAGIDHRGRELINHIRAKLGIFNTVWGVKLIGGRLFWEFYFYDYQRRKRSRSMSDLLAAISPFTHCELQVNESLPYFMFSVDIDADLILHSKPLSKIHVYIGNTGSTISSGICYLITREGLRLENLYYFFDSSTQMHDIAQKAGCSVYLDTTRIPIQDILWPELTNAKTIVIANKQKNDAVYFSRITLDQLLFFMRRLGYPGSIIQYVVQNRHLLDYMLYDVGFDYRVEQGQLVVLKSGYYGVF